MNILKRGTKLSIVVVIICLIVMKSSLNAFAGSTFSNWKTSVVNGYSYDYMSIVFDRGYLSGHTLEAAADVQTTYSGNAPTGYMGAQARLFNEDDELICASSMIYNSSPVGNVLAYSDTISESGYFYAQSKVRLYNGNGYNTYYAYKTPYATIATREMDSYAVNEFEETYGSGLLVEEFGVEPDLIAAVGVDGTKGYVRSEDVSPTPKTIEEALEMTYMASNDQIIPLYNLNGEIVGQFVLTAVQEDKVEELRKEFRK